MHLHEKKFLKGAIDPKHKGYCTPMSKKTCTPRRKALAKRFKKGGDLHNEGLDTLLPPPPAELQEHCGTCPEDVAARGKARLAKLRARRPDLDL